MTQQPKIRSRANSTASSDPFEEPEGGFTGGGFIGGAQFGAEFGGGGGSFGAAPAHQDPMSPEGSFGTMPTFAGAGGFRREMLAAHESPPPQVERSSSNNHLSSSSNSIGFFRYKMYIKHQRSLTSTASTPRRVSPRPLTYSAPGDGASSTMNEDDDFDMQPEGASDSDQRTFNGSFAARTTGVEVEPPMVSDLAMGSALEGGNSALVIGDTTGRIAIWEDPHQPASNLRMMGRTYSDIDRLSLQVSHQAFVPETDCLRSRAIDEKINCVTVLPPRSPGLLSYLAANESQIKLFRIRAGVNDTMRTRKSIVPTSAFTGKHSRGKICSLSVCADRETFLSADEFIVNWWHLETDNSGKATTIVDAQPDGDVSEIYFSAKFSPVHGSLFVMASSSGRCDVGDLRDPPSRKPRGFVHQLHAPEVTDAACEEHKDILASMSDASFLDNHHIVTRDYLGMKLWDLRRAVKPVSSTCVMQYMIPHLDTLYQNDSIFDHFNLATDHTTRCVVTGLYEGSIAVWYPLSRGGKDLEVYKLDADRGPEAYGRMDQMPATSEPITSSQVKKVAISEGGSRISCAFEDNVFAMDCNGRAGRRSRNTSPSPTASSGRTGRLALNNGSPTNCGDPTDNVPHVPSRTLHLPGVGPTGLTLRNGRGGPGASATTAGSSRRLPAASGSTSLATFKIPKRLSREIGSDWFTAGGD